MTSNEIRQSFLDFFKSKQHTIVPSSSLMPDSPNLLFTNAGMNQFVPIFLGQQPCPYNPPRAADTQKCIRAGGKHNDLEDVGLDTYHHTFFEMLGNWSFGDYFKKEAIDWAWELVAEIWKFPKERLYATVYSPDKSKGDPSDFDQEAWDHWAKHFRAAGLDPNIHIVNGNKKDNFWMMGETGPCGPCSELHVDLTPAGDTKGSLVNKGTAECIEIWNLVFIQFNANPDGSFSPLPAKHVDTGMGFERVTAIKQGTKEFSNFGGIISNYETDVFRPIFNRLEQLSGKKYSSTLPKSGSTGDTEQEKTDVAFRVIADHIRTLTFSIADGILPGNNDRNYVLRRILRRAVKYGRTLGFHQPFFYQLVDVLVENMSHVFPEIKQRQELVKNTIKSEEEAFNKTLDRGIDLFRDEVAGRTGASPVPSGAPPDEKNLPATGSAQYSKRHIPHFERPWGKYMVTFTTKRREKLAPDERDLVFKSLKYGHEHNQYLLYAAVVMPDHAHMLFEPQIQKNDESGKPVFWSLAEVLHGIKSTTAHRINKLRNKSGPVWEEESFDRLIRSEADLQEKFGYITGNPWSAGVVQAGEEYSWLWPVQGGATDKKANISESAAVGEMAVCSGGGGAAGDRRGACPPQISGEFAFKLYDTYGFPLDLTQLMAREAGLSVDEAGFNALMEEQRARARASQKKEIISVTHIEGATPTQFEGYDRMEVAAKVLDVIQIKEKLAVILDVSPFYAEMGGQVGDTGTISGGGNVWHVVNTTKAGNTWVHYISESDAPSTGMEVELSVDPARRNAIQRHHTVTHLFHWALHEVVSRDAVQKGSFVGPEKLTFDFNSAALIPAQIRDIEKLVNERILENAGVSWTEIAYSEVKSNPGIMHLFGEKYGDRVRVVQIGGENGKLNGYSMEFCGGTHTRATGEIGYFRITGESAVAAGIRRVEAVAGSEAYNRAIHDFETIHSIAGKLNAPFGEVEKKIDALLAHQKELEKQLKTLQQKQAAEQARALLQKTTTLGKTQAIVQNLGEADGDYLQSTIDALKGDFKGVIVLTGTTNGSVALAAAVSSDLVKQVQAGKIIQAIAPIVGGKGGGRPEFARGAGKDASKIPDALRESEKLIAAL